MVKRSTRTWTLLVPVEVVEDNIFKGFFGRVFGSKRHHIRIKVIAETPEEAVERVGKVLMTFTLRKMFSDDTTVVGSFED